MGQFTSDIGFLEPDLDVYELSATQKHKLGARHVKGDKVYKYAKAAESLSSNALPVWSTYSTTPILAAASIPTSVVATRNKITVTVGALDGLAGDGVFAVDALEGGNLVIYVDAASATATSILSFGILGNDAAVSGGTMTITLDGDLPINLTGGVATVDAMCSPYYNVKVSGNTGMRFPYLGIAQRKATTDEPYVWIQTLY